MNAFFDTVQAKRRTAPRVYVWAPITWLAIIITLPLALGSLDAILGGTAGEPLVAGLVGLIGAVLLGWLPALLLWLIVWGAHGWLGLSSAGLAYRRARRRETLAEARAPKLTATTPVPTGGTSAAEMWAQWRSPEMNPTGCCFTNADTDGFPAHGGPHCQHPDIVARRAEQDA